MLHAQRFAGPRGSYRGPELCELYAAELLRCRGAVIAAPRGGRRGSGGGRPPPATRSAGPDRLRRNAADRRVVRLIRSGAFLTRRGRPAERRAPTQSAAEAVVGGCLGELVSGPLPSRKGVVFVEMPKLQHGRKSRGSGFAPSRRCRCRRRCCWSPSCYPPVGAQRDRPTFAAHEHSTSTALRTSESGAMWRTSGGPDGPAAYMRAASEPFANGAIRDADCLSAARIARESEMASGDARNQRFSPPVDPHAAEKTDRRRRC